VAALCVRFHGTLETRHPRGASRGDSSAGPGHCAALLFRSGRGLLTRVPFAPVSPAIPRWDIHKATPDRSGVRRQRNVTPPGSLRRLARSGASVGPGGARGLTAYDRRKAPLVLESNKGSRHLRRSPAPERGARARVRRSAPEGDNLGSALNPSILGRTSGFTVGGA